MEYTLRVSVAMYGDTIPLVKVAEAMARHTASGHGTLKLHGETLRSVRPLRIKLLVDAAVSGLLKVCNCNGQITSAEVLIGSAPSSDDSIFHLYAKSRHLIEWGAANGDVFHIVDAQARVVEFGPKNDAGDYQYRGFADWGGQTPSVAPPPMAADLQSRGNTTRTPRSDAVDPVIKLAKSKCIDPQDTSQVWAQMLVLANNKHAPFLRTADDGLEYLFKETVKTFTRDALSKRLHPEKRGTPAKRR